MVKFEGLTWNQATAVNADLEKDGYKETVSIENVPEGTCTASVIIDKIKENGKLIKSPMFAVIPFTRKDDKGEILKLKFTGVKLDVFHISSGKKYNGLYVKVTDDLKTVLSDDDNWAKEILLNSEAYTDSQKRARTILKFDSVAK